jgi:hypothetical protein
MWRCRNECCRARVTTAAFGRHDFSHAAKLEKGVIPNNVRDLRFVWKRSITFTSWLARVGASCFSRGSWTFSPAAEALAPHRLSAPRHLGPAIVGFLIETPKRLKIAVTYCKQKRAMHSNRVKIAPFLEGDEPRTNAIVAACLTVVKSCVCLGTPIRPMRFACIEKH